MTSTSLKTHKLLAHAFIVAGAVLTIVSATQVAFEAQLVAAERQLVESYQPFTLPPQQLDVAVSHVETLKPAGELHTAAPQLEQIAGAGTSVQIVTGMLLLLIGLFYYALLVMKNETSYVQNASRSKKSVVEMDYYWLEIHR